MKQYLENNCKLIKHDVELSIQILKGNNVCKELTPLRDWLMVYLKDLDKKLTHDLYLLGLDDEETFRNIFKRSQKVMRDLVFYNTHFMPSIHRYKTNDNLCLKLLSWLHNEHPILVGHPFGLSDGNFMIAPFQNNPTMYYLPNSSQHTLLHLPLFFHEVGHKFFDYHRPEMMDLVKEFQRNLLQFFELTFRGNTKRYEKQAKKAKIVVIDTWINWIEELFCDAVGIRIGGASYIHAFSHYLRMSGRASFLRKEKDLAGSSHPIAWLRVKFLVKWAEEHGLADEAKSLSEEWQSLAEMQKITEQFGGFYIDDFYDDVKQCLDDMLIVSEPINFKDYDNRPEEFDKSTSNFIELTNLAWRKFYNDLEGYEAWEKNIIESINQPIV